MYMICEESKHPPSSSAKDTFKVNGINYWKWSRISSSPEEFAFWSRAETSMQRMAVNYSSLQKMRKKFHSRSKANFIEVDFCLTEANHFSKFVIS